MNILEQMLVDAPLKDILKAWGYEGNIMILAIAKLELERELSRCASHEKKLIHQRLFEIKTAMHEIGAEKKHSSKYEQRKESFAKFESEYSDLSKLTLKNIHETLRDRALNIWGIKYSSFIREFWSKYTKERPELKR